MKKTIIIAVLVSVLSGCATSMEIDPAKVRTFTDPATGMKCYELIDRDGAPHFACVRVPQ